VADKPREQTLKEAEKRIKTLVKELLKALKEEQEIYQDPLLRPTATTPATFSSSEGYPIGKLGEQALKQVAPFCFFTTTATTGPSRSKNRSDRRLYGHTRRGRCGGYDKSPYGAKAV